MTPAPDTRLGRYVVLSPLGAGESLNVGFLRGVQQTGNFRSFVIVEALP